MEQDIWQYYQTQYPGQVQVLGPDEYNGSASQLQTFKDATGATFPLLIQAYWPPGNNFFELYGPWNDFVVINKLGIVRYHAALTWTSGSRYHLNEIRACVDTLVSSAVGVEDPGGARGFRLTSAPNPFGVGTTVELAYPLAGTAHARIAVYDLAGREEALLLDRDVFSGVTRTPWDGRTAAGVAAAPGVYVLRARVGSVALSRRVVVAR